MSLKTMIRRANTLIKSQKWSALSLLGEELLESHENELSYDVVMQLSRVLIVGEQYGSALRLAKAALKKDFNRVDALESMFFIMLKKQKTQNASEILDLLEARSDSVDYREWRVSVLNLAGDNEKLIEMVRSGSVKLDPSRKRFTETFFAYGVALLNENCLQDVQKLISGYRQYLDFKDPNVLHLLAKIALASGDSAEAVEYYDSAIDVATGRLKIELQWNRSLALLAFGHTEKGWRDYEVRWQWENFTSSPLNPDAELWAGESLAGKTLLIWGEQGVGDEIMFLTLVPSLSALGPKCVSLAVSKKVVPVVKAWYPNCDVVSNEEILDPESTRTWDYHLAAGSLPLRLGLPNADGPRQFLPRSKQSREIRARLLDHGAFRKVVGLSWRSGLLTHKRVGTYLSVVAIRDLVNAAPPDIAFISLQYSITTEEKEVLTDTGRVLVPDVDFFDELVLQTEYIQACDLVISSSSVCLQLSGICGVPTITWGPEREWSILGFDRGYPWYQTVHYIKCAINWDLGSLVVQLKKLLGKFYLT